VSSPFNSALIIARAPLRISFAGGGTDLPAYYEQHGGAVLSTTISRSVYALLAPGDYEQVNITTSDYRATHAGSAGPESPSGSLALPQAVVQAMRLDRGVTIADALDHAHAAATSDSAIAGAAARRRPRLACGPGGAGCRAARGTATEPGGTLSGAAGARVSGGEPGPDVSLVVDDLGAVRRSNSDHP